MDRAEEAKLKLLFGHANEWLGGKWTLAPENTAEVLVIDLESMYGHMTWLKVHNSGRYIIALSSREHSEAEHLLLRPVTVESMVTALSNAIGKPVPQEQPRVSASDAMSSSQQAGAAPPESVPRSSRISKPLPELAALPSAPLQPPPAVANVATPAPIPAAIGPLPSTSARPPPAAAQSSAPPQPPPASASATPRDPTLWDYLQQGKLLEPSKMELQGAPPLVIDPRTDTYIGGSALKPYIPYCQLGNLRAGQWQELTGPEIKQFRQLLGEEPQPLGRLRWLHALVRGAGELAPGYDPDARYRLTRWPKTEREYPRHFRIATVMMQAPATLAEIAAQSNTTLQEVNDFVNASLDSGFAEPYVPPPPAPDTPAKSSGLFGRLRGR